jgi:FixJ family two-component response regulator
MGRYLENTTPIVHIVDDDPSFLRALVRLLRSMGFQVERFISAEELLEHRRKIPDAPGCVIVDLELPGLNGLELQESLKQQRDPLPVIFLTGHGDVPSSVRAMKQEAVDFLTKPVCADDLVAAVNRAFAADAAVREARHQRLQLLALYEDLTPREREVLALVARGMLNKEIAFELGTVERTVKAHRAQVMSKMQVQSVAELVRITERLENSGILKKEN